VSNTLTTTNSIAINSNISGNLSVAGALISNATNTTIFFDTLTIPYVNTLTMNSAAVTTGSLTASGTSSFANIIVANLQVTNTFIITATNTQTTNSLSVINQGTTTALYVNQNEFPNQTYYNVAEFWDHTQLAMVIDGSGNVAIHTASSPGYAFTVVQGALIDSLTVSGKFSASGNNISNIQGSSINNGNLISNISASSVYGPFANIFVSNSVTTTNLFSNTETIFGATGQTSLNVTGNIYASNAITTSNINAAGFTSNATNTNYLYDTLTIPFIYSTTANTAGTSNIFNLVATTITSSNAVTTTNLFANTLTLSNATSVLSVTGNVYASNALSTTNIFATVNVVIGQGITALQANLHVEQSNVFIGNSACIGAVTSLSNPVNSLIFDNSTSSGLFPNKIVLFSNTSLATNAAGYAGFGYDITGSVLRYFSRTAHSFYTGPIGNQTSHMSITSGGQIYVNNSGYIGGQIIQNSYRLQLAGYNVGQMTTNVTLRIESSNISMTTGPSLAGFGTDTPSANLHVIGNVYASNALSTTNVLATRFSAGGFTVVAGGPTVGVTGNIFASNALSTTNIFASNILNVGTGTIGSNVALFSNIAGGSNVVVINSNAWVGIGTTNPTSSLAVNGNAAFSTDTFVVPFATVGTLGVLSGATIGPSSTVLGSNLMVFSNASGGSNVTIFTGNTVGISNLAPATTLSVGGTISALGNATTYGTLAPVTWRQGSSATDWSGTAGVRTPYALGTSQVQIQCGSNAITTSSTITFPSPYINTPIVMVTPYTMIATPLYITSPSNTGFTINGPSAVLVSFEWISIGI
jgi:hypothetical protein